MQIHHSQTRMNTQVARFGRISYIRYLLCRWGLKLLLAGLLNKLHRRWLVAHSYCMSAREALSRSALLLDAAPVTLEMGERDRVAQHAQVEKVDRQRFTDEELKELYGLLRIGHYKTKPSDLETFLDAKGIIWLSLKHENKHVGITISGIEEPVEDVEKAHGLWLGRCQVPQNLTAQTLSRDAGSLEASQLRYCRMMRWCLHPALRGYGLGERLLEQSLVHLKSQEVDAVAAHFGATSWLMKLWLRQGAQIVFVSHGCDPSSGQHSISVLIPRTEAARQLVKCLQKQLAMQIFELLAGPLADMETLAGAFKDILIFIRHVLKRVCLMMIPQ